VSDADAAVVDKIASESKLQALRTIAILPVIMLVVYLGLIFYFRKKGGYKPVVLDIKH
jgi:DHA2 family metal-tetracycline-proton antiporter-like MFS transporter